MNICRSKDGHVKLWYKINDSDLSDDNNAFIVFTKMLFMAHFEDDFSSIRFNGEQYKLKAGEFSASLSELSNHVNIPPSTLRKVVERLENDKRISKRTDRQTTVYSICNWSKYQGNKKHIFTNDIANDIANDRTNDRTNDIANVTEGKKNIKNIKNINIASQSSNELLPLHVEICQLFGKSPDRYKLLPKRRITLKARLKDTGKDNIIKACTALANSEWHMGDNDRNWIADPYWCLSSAEKAEDWSSREKQTKGYTGKLSEFEIIGELK